MKPFFQHNGQTIYQGHVMDVLMAMPDESVHMVCTSPPYWGLRDYNIEPQVWDDPGDCQHEWGDEIPGKNQGGGIDTGVLKGGGNADDRNHFESTSQFCRHCQAWRGSLGLEPTPDLFVSHLVQVFREVKRVMRPDATLWLNLGDSYAGGNTKGSTRPGSGRANGEVDERHQRNRDGNPCPPGLKPKDLCMMPARVALALQADGFYLRQQIIWAKGVSFCDTYSGSVMPESVRDRFCSSYEVVYLLSKSPRYFFDLDAVKEKSTGQNGQAANFKRDTKDHIIPNQSVAQHRADRNPTVDSGGRTPRSVWAIPDPDALAKWLAANHPELLNEFNSELTTPKDIFAINPQPLKSQHFASFPERLVQKCILSGTSAKGVCSECGAPHVRVVEKGELKAGRLSDAQYAKGKLGTELRQVHDKGWNYEADFAPGLYRQTKTLGWQPSCSCNADTVPAVVLDPFLGSGTVLKVAKQLGRHGIGAELNPEYCEMAVDRIGAQEMLW